MVLNQGNGSGPGAAARRTGPRVMFCGRNPATERALPVELHQRLGCLQEGISVREWTALCSTTLQMQMH